MLELSQLWVLDLGFELGSRVDSESVEGSLADSESAVGSKADSTLAGGSTLGFGFGTGFAVEGCFRPATSQSIEGNF